VYIDQDLRAWDLRVYEVEFDPDRLGLKYRLETLDALAFQDGR